MKKLKRKNLDELREILPKMTEDQQRACRGGTLYHDLSGNYLGQVGTGRDLRFCDPMMYASYEAYHIEGGGASLMSTSDTTRNSFIAAHSTFTNPMCLSGTPNDLAAGLTVSGVLVINTNSSVWNNYDDAIATLAHEQYHFDNHHYLLTGVYERNMAEITAYLSQIGTLGFASTTREYKTTVADCLYYYYSGIGVYMSHESCLHMVGL